MNNALLFAGVLIIITTGKGLLVLVGTFFDQGDLGRLIRQNYREFFTKPKLITCLTFVTLAIVKLMAGFYAVEHGHSYLLWLLMFEHFLPHGIYLVYVILRPFNNWAK